MTSQAWASRFVLSSGASCKRFCGLRRPLVRRSGEHPTGPHPNLRRPPRVLQTPSSASSRTTTRSVRRLSRPCRWTARQAQQHRRVQNHRKQRWHHMRPRRRVSPRSPIRMASWSFNPHDAHRSAILAGQLCLSIVGDNDFDRPDPLYPSLSQRRTVWTPKLAPKRSIIAIRPPPTKHRYSAIS